jgi:hypothetical protein
MRKSDRKKVGRAIFSKHVKWDRTKDETFPFLANVEGVAVKIRLNEFPDEHLYTLFVEDEETFSFNTWPVQWERPNLGRAFADAALTG